MKDFETISVQENCVTYLKNLNVAIYMELGLIYTIQKVHYSAYNWTGWSW